MNILAKDWRENLKKAGIKDYKQDILHIENQMKDEQIGSLGSVDTHEVKKDKRMTRKQQGKKKLKQKVLLKSIFLTKMQILKLKKATVTKKITMTQIFIVQEAKSQREGRSML